MEGKHCLICLEDYDGPKTLCVLKNCNHIFHYHCILTWSRIKLACPICKMGIEPPASFFEYRTLYRLFSPQSHSLFLAEDPNFSVTVQTEDQHSNHGSSRIRGNTKGSNSGIRGNMKGPKSGILRKFCAALKNIKKMSSFLGNQNQEPLIEDDQESNGYSRIRAKLKGSKSGVLETSYIDGALKITRNKSTGSKMEDLSDVDRRSTMEELKKFKRDYETKRTFQGKKSVQVSEFLKFKKDFETNRMEMVNGCPEFIITTCSSSRASTSAVEEEKSLPFSGSGAERRSKSEIINIARLLENKD